MRRLPAALLFICLIVLTCGFSLKEWRSSIYDSIKGQAESGFSALFHRSVTIGSAGGWLVGRIELYNMTIPGLGRAEKVVLTYNPVAYALAKGDMVPALTKISVINGDFRVERDRSGTFTILNAFSGGGASSGPPPFHGRVVLRNCSVEYIDQRGYKEEPENFYAAAQKVNGNLDLRKKGWLKFSVSGRVPETVKASGSLDLTTNKFDLTVSAEKLDLKKWANYTIPLPGLEAQAGKVDLTLRVAPPKTPGWAAALTGRATFYDASADFQTHKFSAASGTLFIDDEKLALQGLAVKLNGCQLTVNGRFFDFSRGNFDLALLVRTSDLKNLTAFWPQLNDLNPSGTGTAQIKLSGTVANPAVSGIATVDPGMFYGQSVSGAVKFSYKDKVLAADSSDLRIYGGSSSAHLNLDLNKSSLLLNGKMAGLDLAALAQRSPGIEGKADGTFELAGPLKAMEGKVSAQLSHGLVFGQPLDTVSSSFKIVDNIFHLGDFTAASGNVAFRAAGLVTSDLDFDLRAEAAGFRLKGKGAFGDMAATLNNFKGRMSWKLDKEFLAQPLRNLTASGEVVLTDGRVGEQSFDEARGGISIGGGAIMITEARLQKSKSVVRLGGVTGLGVPTKLFLSGDDIDLTDLKLFEPFLPEETRGSTGTASFEIEVTGELSKETALVSFDPLLDLTAHGHFQVINARLADTDITKALLKFDWRDRALSLSDARITTPYSQLELNLTYKKDGSLEGSLEGIADLSYYRSLTSRYGKIAGQAGFGVTLSGSLECPLAATSFWLHKFWFNDIYFDDISGSLAYCVNRYYTIQPIIFQNGLDHYSLAGDLAFDPLTPEASQLSASLKVVQADLSSTYLMLYKIEGEVARRVFSSSQAKPFVRIDLSALRLPDISAYDRKGRFRLYQSDGKKQAYLQAFAAVNRENQKTLAAAPSENMGGSLTAEAFVSGKLNNLAGWLTGRVAKGYFRDYQFDSFVAQAVLKDRTVRLDKAVLSKSGGSLMARGSINFDGALSFSLSAAKMPLDIMLLAFPHKEYKGTFNMTATAEGAWPNPEFTLAAGGKALSVAGIAFDEVELSLSKSPNYISLNKFSLRKGDVFSSAAGYLSLVHPGLVSLEARLNGNAVGLLNLFTDQVEWRGGGSDLYLKVSGTLDEPKIAGHLSVADGDVHIKALDSDLKNIEGSAEVEGGVLSIAALTGILTGKRTKDVPDPVGLAGTIDLSRVLSTRGSLGLNLAFSPTLLYANFPNLYVGTLRLKGLSLRGPLYFDGSDGPALAGRVELNNSVITLSQPSGGRAFPLHLDVNLDLTKNDYAVMGDVATLNLSNILMNLEVGGSLRVSGLLEAPDLLGKIMIKRGTVNIFNREFSLLTAESQKKYSLYGSLVAGDNVADFRGNGTQPDLDITASVDVINQEKDVSGNPVKKKVNILANLSGNPGVKEEAEALKISLAGFTEDTTKSPSEYVPAAYTEQDLKVMLLPDFIKSLAGINQAQGAVNNVDTNAVVADYLSSRVQSLLFRSLEREAEQTLGLESLTLEYNFGPQIGQALGVKDITGFEQKPAWSVGFVKGFFDRLYLEVRYAQPTDQSIVTSYGESYINYQLTYKLTSIWSIIYYVEPIAVTQPTGDQKVTLKAGFSLW